MSRYSYAGPYRNPTEGYFVQAVREHFEIWIRHDRESDGSCAADRKVKIRYNKFEEYGDAMEAIAEMAEAFEEDYDQYLEENHYDIVQMERYEAFRNEY